MSKLRPRRPSGAMMVAIVAVLIALGGTAVAGSGIPLKAFSNKTKTQTVGVGPLTYVKTFAVIPPTSSNGLDVAAACPAGTTVIGGGIQVSSDSAELVNDSFPSGTSWLGTVINTSSTVTHSATTTAICATSRLVQ